MSDTLGERVVADLWKRTGSWPPGYSQRRAQSVLSEMKHEIRDAVNECAAEEARRDVAQIKAVLMREFDGGNRPIRELDIERAARALAASPEAHDQPERILPRIGRDHYGRH